MMTPTAICGLEAGASAVNTASFRPVLFVPFWAVPVFPAMSRPGVWMPGTLNAVPFVAFTTLSIICLTWLAVVALTGWLSCVGVVCWTVVRSGALTSWTR